jgi:pSer/pThr/pTyr-binding forkhead associated (FHA) protein
MDEDLTVLQTALPHVGVRIRTGPTWSDERQFTQSFRIGRSPACEVRLQERIVSKVHAEVRYDDARWWIADLSSANGTYLNGARIVKAPLESGATVQLGEGGPLLTFTVQGAIDPVHETGAHAKQDPSATQIIERYLDPSPSNKADKQAEAMREAFRRVSRQRSRKYQWIAGVLLLLLFGAGGWAIHEHRRVEKMKATAGEMFYTMKQMELQIAQLEEMISTTNLQQMQEILAKRQNIRDMERQYDRFLEEIGIYSPGMSEQDRAVFRMARLFGECEATMPKEFLSEVKKYIQRWRSTERLLTAIRRAEESGYVVKIANAMVARNLPPQYLFLALQESGFDPHAVGPKTRYGYAKGIWQFIPRTAEDFGLRTGPLKEVGRYDPQDERYHFEKATDAAARYLKRLYTTDAQASGLLVMASYNWGEGNVLGMIRKMPKNPKERNFWELLKQYKIPNETRDYVFYIISAAVIADNPKLFGFAFSNPFPEFAHY